MKRLLLCGACAIALSGCASFAASPNAVSANVSAAVNDTKTVTTGAVTIVGDLVSAGLALISPITMAAAALGTLGL